MKTKTITAQIHTVPTYEEYIYTTAEKAVYIALRARHEKSGLQFLADLQNDQTNDRIARNAPEIAGRIADLQADHDSHTAGAAYFDAQAHRITLHHVERAVAQSLANDLKTKAHREQTQLNDLYNALNITFSDCADLVQTACLQILENEQNPAPITPGILASYGADTPEDLTPEDLAQAQNAANFRTVINAVGRAIGDIARPEALNRTTTIKTPATPGEVQNWVALYGDTGKAVKIPQTVKRSRASDCYDTMEYLTTKTAPGWYRIRHYVTVAPYQYIETYTEDEDGETDPAYLKSYNPFIDSVGALEQIEELYTTAKLTDRQKAFLEAFSRHCRISSDFTECKEYAFKTIGITTTTNKTTFFNRLKKALTK